MSLQPKTRKYRYSFRNKTRTSGYLPSDICIRKLKNKNCFRVNTNGPSLQESGGSAFLTSVFNNSRKDKCWTLAKSVASFTDKVSQISIIAKNYKQQDPCLTYSTMPNNNSFTTFLHFPLTAESKGQNSVEKNFSGSQWAHFSDKTSILKLKVDPKALSVNKVLDASPLASTNKAGTLAHSFTALDKVKFGECGFYFCDWGTITAKYIETIRLTIARKLKKSGRFWIRTCPDTPVTARSAETRMGRGKGAISYYEAKVRPGQMFMEFDGVPQETIDQIFRELTKKTNIKIKIG